MVPTKFVRKKKRSDIFVFFLKIQGRECVSCRAWASSDIQAIHRWQAVFFCYVFDMSVIYFSLLLLTSCPQQLGNAIYRIKQVSRVRHPAPLITVAELVRGVKNKWKIPSCREWQGRQAIGVSLLLWNHPNNPNSAIYRNKQVSRVRSGIFIYASFSVTRDIQAIHRRQAVILYVFDVPVIYVSLILLTSRAR